MQNILVPQSNISYLQQSSRFTVSKKHGKHSPEEHQNHENACYIFEHHTSELRIDANPSVYTDTREGKPLSTEQPTSITNQNR
jgi:hypothetical protein